ncbi:membrane-bound lytic murein transglycosylase B [Halopseudomonas xinjiangensis]|uniref:Membrane-bound lytic murein transglycosylase B n=1 Tax=Halopseudomonas xinjiangensis TaxID=487184 RepID=A0A1H1MCV8_9GAMM|nr:lytic murein transglycosylase [Halopseudomonas xinjiangensis]SDR84507.1 membrane-bound lytic murein transglycosylase B [Halopseudomonas xinjiangensis]
MLKKAYLSCSVSQALAASALGLTLLSACGSSAVQTAAEPAASTPVLAMVEDVIRPESFAAWRDEFRQQVLEQGVPADLFERIFADMQVDPAVIKADRSQPEFTRPVWEYLDGALSSQRLGTGQRLLLKHADALAAIEQRYGVDRHVLVAIWGLESNFGNNIGDRNVMRSLATLAYEGRRPDFARNELFAALDIIRNGDIEPDNMVGSWAGAMGQTQFIPSTYNRYAVDFDGDGRRDVWQSSADALGSAAHYLSASNWQPGQPWGMEISVPRQFNYSLADMAVRKTVAEWAELGVTEVGGTPLDPSLAERHASVLLPAGYRGPAFLVLNNFRSILRYNNSTSYALAIGLLSERFQGKGRVQASWPTEDKPLSRSERHELQERLQAAGFEPGGVDGILGANTRQAIRRFQQMRGWPADGYATQGLLDALRAHDQSTVPGL